MKNFPPLFTTCIREILIKKVNVAVNFTNPANENKKEKFARNKKNNHNSELGL